jgi:hypothetical protein
MAEKDYTDPEKGIEPVKSRTSVDEHGHKHSITGRKTSVAESIIAADLLDERYNITHRGLKSRHAQMIALGGTIGTGYVPIPLSAFVSTNNCSRAVSLSVLAKLSPSAAQHSFWSPIC